MFCLQQRNEKVLPGKQWSFHSKNQVTSKHIKMGIWSQSMTRTPIRKEGKGGRKQNSRILTQINFFLKKNEASEAEIRGKQ